MQEIPSEDLEKMSRIIDSTISVEVRHGLLKKTIGAGVLIKLNRNFYIVTAKHVAVEAKSLPVYGCGLISKECKELVPEELLNKNLEKIHLDQDWALFKINDLPKKSRAAKLGLSELDLGERVTLFGFPYGRGPWLSKGHIAWVWKTENGELMGIDAYAAPGFSGGGVFNGDGELIGIVVAISLTPEGTVLHNQVLAVPLRGFLPI